MTATNHSSCDSSDCYSDQPNCAKIGELTLENDFLEGALNKAGLLNAKR